MAETRWWIPESSDGDLSASDLKHRTETYWNDDRAEEVHLAHYVETLLPYELHFAQKRGALEAPPCHTLALLVGYSLEPLFQAIGAFEPRRIVLLLNRTYGCPEIGEGQSGKQRGDDVKRWIETLLIPLMQKPEPEHSLKENEIVVEARVIGRPGEKADQPDTVFRALCDHVLKDQKEGRAVVVDITGAKKSMDVGAFLFAAYAGIPVSYVDFDCYHPEKRRPYGYTCRLGQLRNPYESFELHGWEEVQHLYEKYHFRAARKEALQKVILVMRRSLAATEGYALFDKHHVAAAKRLRLVLHFYEAWDDGDYYRANRLLTYLAPPWFLSHLLPPTAVVVLADLWASLGVTPRQWEIPLDERTRLDSQFLMSNELLLTYANDELAKIERLVRENEDNRSALLRAVGLDELLLKARWVRLWNAGEEGWINLWKEQRREGGRGPRFIGTCRASPLEDLYEELIKHSGDAYYMRSALQSSEGNRKTGNPPFLPLKADRNYYRACPVPGAPRLQSYEQKSLMSTKLLTDLRNQAIHKYQYVARSAAQAAFELAKANLEDFENAGKGWVHLANETDLYEPGETTGVEQLPWQRVCALCGLDFLPFVPQRKEGEIA